MTDDIEPLRSLNSMIDWLDHSGVGAGPITQVVTLTGGTQNVLVKFTRDGHDYVLRRPPTNKRRNSDEAMRREARVLAALTGSTVPHPQLRASEEDESRFGDACFVMDAIDGFTATEDVPAHIVASREAQRRMGFDAVDALLGLQDVDPHNVGLPVRDHWIDSQVDRWASLYASHTTHAGWSTDQIEGVDQVAEWLRSNVPTTSRTGLVHGDFHFGNILFSREDGGLTAVIDWELASIGDPLLDLGHFLASYPVSNDPRTTGTAEPLTELPSRGELISRYIAHTGRNEADVTWFRILACFRLAIIIEGSHARAIAGLVSAETGERLHNAASYLMEQAVSLVIAEQAAGTVAQPITASTLSKGTHT